MAWCLVWCLVVFDGMEVAGGVDVGAASLGAGVVVGAAMLGAGVVVGAVSVVAGAEGAADGAVGIVVLGAAIVFGAVVVVWANAGAAPAISATVETVARSLGNVMDVSNPGRGISRCMPAIHRMPVAATCLACTPRHVAGQNLSITARFLQSRPKYNTIPQHARNDPHQAASLSDLRSARLRWCGSR